MPAAEGAAPSAGHTQLRRILMTRCGFLLKRLWNSARLKLDSLDCVAGSLGYWCCTQRMEAAPRDGSSFPSQLPGFEVIRITELISWQRQAGDPGSAVLNQRIEK